MRDQQQQHRRRMALMMITPALMILAGLALYPIARIFYLSLFQVNLATGFTSHFTGLNNYRRLLSDSLFWQSLGNTAIFTIVSVSLELVLGIVSALLLHAHF